MGMTAGPGVIDRIAIDPDSAKFDIHTIDGLKPRGICGSGVIDLAAQLFLAGKPMQFCSLLKESMGCTRHGLLQQRTG